MFHVSLLRSESAGASTSAQRVTCNAASPTTTRTLPLPPSTEVLGGSVHRAACNSRGGYAARAILQNGQGARVDSKGSRLRRREGAVSSIGRGRRGLSWPRPARATLLISGLGVLRRGDSRLTSFLMFRVDLRHATEPQPKPDSLSPPGLLSSNTEHAESP